MRRTRTLASWSGLAVVAAALSLPLSAEAAPTEPDPSGTTAVADGGRGPSTAASASRAGRAEVARRAAAAPPVADPIEMPTSYPYQPAAAVLPRQPGRRRDLRQTCSPRRPRPAADGLDADRATASPPRWSGSRPQGRDLYLVTVTAPERRRTRPPQQTAWQDEIRDRPGGRGRRHRAARAATRPRSGSAPTSTATSGRAPTRAMDYIE